MARRSASSWSPACSAETGFKDLFTGLYNEVCETPNQKRTIRSAASSSPYDTSHLRCRRWGSRSTPNLGKGSDMVRMIALSQIKHDQQLMVSPVWPQQPRVRHSGDDEHA